MKINLKLLFLIAVISIIFLQQQFSQELLTPQQIYSERSEAVVMVYTYDANDAMISFASGVFVSTEGVIFTNFHIIEYAFRIEVRKGLTVYNDIKILAINKENDAAILKAGIFGNNYIEPGSSELAMIGETVYAIGNPNGLERTFSSGILSGKREIEKCDLIQYTASISNGSSGGALLNSKGELIGITNSSYDGNQNLNFAIPVEKFKIMMFADHTENNITESMDSLCRKYLRIDEGYDYVTDTLLLNLAHINGYSPGAVRELARYAMYFRYDELALDFYNYLFACGTEDKELYLQRGICYSNNGDMDSAFIDLEKALLIDPGYIDAYITRADSYMRISKYKEALGDYSEAIRLNPGDHTIYSLRAECCIQTGDTISALNDLYRSVTGSSRFASEFVNRAEKFEKLGLYDESIDDYTAAINISGNPWCYFRRAILYSKTSRHLNAAADYLVYLTSEPYDASALNNLAYCYLDENDYELAEKYFLKALKCDHAHFDSYIGLSLLHYRQKNIRKSLNEMSKAINTKGLLEQGVNGLSYLKQTGYFWDKDEEEDIIKIFGIMGLETKISKHKIRSFRVSAQNPN